MNLEKGMPRILQGHGKIVVVGFAVKPELHEKAVRAVVFRGQQRLPGHRQECPDPLCPCFRR